MTLIDSHTHLDRFARSGELSAILDRARAAGVREMIAIGTEPGDWELYRELAAAHSGEIHYAVGLHPCSVEVDWEAAVSKLAAAIETEPKPVAIGETGLDRFHLPKDAALAAEIFERQRQSFARHLEIAKTTELPLVVHSRGASRECIDMIDASGVDWARVVFHCFAEGPEVIGELNRRGGRGSFTGIVTYKSAENVRQAALAQGLDMIMVETDAPYLTPEPHRGKRNEPAFVAHTAERLANVFDVSLEAFAEVATRNTREFFGLPTHS